MNSEILEKYKLERSLPTEVAKAFEKVLKKSNESYVILWEKKKHCKVGNYQFWNFEIWCPKTTFADAFFHLGFRYNKDVYPIWKKCSERVYKSKRGSKNK